MRLFLGFGDGFTQAHKHLPDNMPYYRHIGMYAYTVAFLKRYCQWEASILETVESLEQLRILWQGEPIRVKLIENAPPAGVDTETVLQRVKAMLEGRVVS